MRLSTLVAVIVEGVCQGFLDWRLPNGAENPFQRVMYVRFKYNFISNRRLELSNYDSREILARDYFSYCTKNSIYHGYSNFNHFSYS